MNITDIIAQIRSEADDQKPQDYLWDNLTLLGLINNSVDEAAIRKRLIFDNTTTAICQISITPANATYAIDPSIIDISNAYIIDPNQDPTQPWPYGALKIVSREYMDTYFWGWQFMWGAAQQPWYGSEDCWNGSQDWLIYDEQSVTIVSQNVFENMTLNLEVYRVALSTEKMTIPIGNATPSSPVISAVHHPYLYHWPLSVLYNRRDLDQYAPDRAKYHLDEFEKYFGKRPQASQIRENRQNRPHRNRLHI